MIVLIIVTGKKLFQDWRLSWCICWGKSSLLGYSSNYCATFWRHLPDEVFERSQSVVYLLPRSMKQVNQVTLGMGQSAPVISRPEPSAGVSSIPFCRTLPGRANHLYQCSSFRASTQVLINWNPCPYSVDFDESLSVWLLGKHCPKSLWVDLI